MNDEFAKLAGEAPTLTLDPFAEAEKTADAVSQTAQAVTAEVKTAAETPILQMQEKPQVPAEKKEENAVDESMFSEAERAQIAAFAEKIDIQNSNVILQYGAAAQQKLADFSEKALENVKTQDLGEVGDMLASVVTELKNFNADEQPKGFFGFLKKNENKLETMKAKFDKTEVNVEKICDALEEHQVRLLKDTATLDQMYELNTSYFKELSMYIAAGKKKLEQVRSTELVELTEKAKRSSLPEDAQAAKDLASYCDRFEKKLHDLELSRMVSLQTAPQLRLIQNNNTMMIEKIQSTLVNTIPLWKNQMVIALGLEHASEAAKAQNAVSEMTNELLKRNAEALHTATVATAKESERGIVDIETLTQTNAKLVQTFDEVLQIQAEGRQKRQAAEAEMLRMENELKAKLLEIRK